MAITKVKTESREDWLPVFGFEGKYEVSSLGEVKSLNFHRSGTSKTLKQYTDRYGYRKVILYRYGKPHYFTVHRLVAVAFLQNPEGKSSVDHIDCDRTNNRVENLRWVSNKENLYHSHKMGRQVINAKPITVVSEAGEKLVFASQREAARALGLTQCSISRATLGRKQDLKGWAICFD